MRGRRSDPYCVMGHASPADSGTAMIRESRRFGILSRAAIPSMAELALARVNLGFKGKLGNPPHSDSGRTRDNRSWPEPAQLGTGSRYPQPNPRPTFAPIDHAADMQ